MRAVVLADGGLRVEERPDRVAAPRQIPGLELAGEVVDPASRLAASRPAIG